MGDDTYYIINYLKVSAIRLYVELQEQYGHFTDTALFSIQEIAEKYFNDADVVLELLTQVYQFSRLYWKSLRQQNVPLTIKYPEMVAQIAPRFYNGVPDDAKDALWFL